ncbi:hypothetical protein EF900_18240, partial [Staphylococcus aureus]
GTLYNIVGFQTHLKWGAQKEVIRLIPGLENVDINRFYDAVLEAEVAPTK